MGGVTLSKQSILAPEPNFQCGFDELALNVAIHVRRGDITASTDVDDAGRREGIEGEFDPHLAAAVAVAVFCCRLLAMV